MDNLKEYSFTFEWWGWC